MDADETLDIHQSYIDGCKKVLNAIISSKSSNNFNQETWSVILRVMLGVSDVLLSMPLPKKKDRHDKHNLDDETEVGMMMAESLGSHVLATLFQSWLWAGIIEGNLWKKLKSLFLTWTHRIQVISYWSVLLVGLTKFVIVHMHDPEDLVVDMQLSLNNGCGQAFHTIKAFECKQTNDFLLYAWHRFTCICFLI